MPRVRVLSATYKYGDDVYKKGQELGLSDEEYRANKKKLEFLAPTTDRIIQDGRAQEIVREDSKP